MIRTVVIATFCFCALTVLFFSPTHFADTIRGNIYLATLTAENSLESLRLLGAAYESLTSSNTRYIGIVEGMRTEEIATICKKKFGWNDTETAAFADELSCTTETDEGYLSPGAYVVKENASPKDMKLEMTTRSNTVLQSLLEKYSLDPETVDMDTVVTVASLIQREAAGKRDMRLISGIIWNRLATDMPLQIDATLQYVKGKDGRWWPFVLPKDKFVTSPYNTYQNKGLPPTPIANPGEAALEAALNPEKTSCMFYLHDKYKRIHCSETYEGHKKNIEMYL